MHPAVTTRLPPPTPTATGRLPWADAAKGLCIVLVVLHHLTTKHYELVVPDGTLVEAAWQEATDLLRPVRMPLFFLLSGMFAAGAVQRPWRDVLRRRVATPYYLYVVWLVLHAIAFSVLTALPMNRTRSLSELAVDVVLASTGLWYLYALALYFVLAKAVRPLDARVVVPFAAAISAGASLLPIEGANRESLVQHFVFFLVGTVAPHLVRAVPDIPGRHVDGSLAAGSAALAVVAWSLGLPQSATTLLVAVLAVPLAIRMVAAACTRPWFEGPAARLGRQTLPIYVLHVPLLALVHLVVVQLPGVDGLSGSTAGLVALAGYPVLATVLVTVACLLVHAGLERAGLGVLFHLPDPGRFRPVPASHT